ncbi:dipeptide ABC transporter ATP-binding protein [Nesterenkonia muleiensis]|uniref:dipeptide ABC transporter ATP-binding protein n=1 Tax=Nesterenkonia muleiensis TaxID=2282648 RepID=UPI00192E4547|nr:ABC transporter ATP-binding protein [Nesterenkonia muleiensis]
MTYAVEDGSLLLSVKGLTVSRRGDKGLQSIVKDVDLTLSEGETIGIVGESGSGKSVTAQSLIGLAPKALTVGGNIEYKGSNISSISEKRIRSLRGSDLSMILQDPFTILNPLMRAGRIIVESLSDGGKRLSREHRRALAVERLKEVGIHDESVIDQYPFQLSGGMRQRLAIAAALASDPTILIADEPSTALDVTTQRETMSLIKQLQVERGMGLILITHDLRVAFNMCDRIYVMYAGSVIEHAPADQFEEAPMHPYTHGLLRSEPPIARRVKELVSVPGTVPTPGEVTVGCVFASRCRWVTPECVEISPPLLDLGENHASACIRISEIAGEIRQVELEAADAEPGVNSERPEPLVSVKEVGKEFRASRGNMKVAVDRVDLEVGAGECVGLVGESGSGKTTLARMIAGLEEPSNGSILIDGIEASNWRSVGKAARRQLRSTLQVVFQDPYSTLNPQLRIGTVLKESVLVHNPGIRDVRAKVEQLLDRVGLSSSIADQRPSSLSGGMRQRVAIARALSAEPKFLIFDEPVSALDVSVQAQILNLIRNLNRDVGVGFLFITHDLAVVRQVTDYLYVMKLGRVVEQGYTEDVLTDPRENYTKHLLDSVPRKSGWLSAART